MKDRHIWWSLTISNSISVICWTALAIVFNKWWIALFSILFLTYLKTDNKKVHKYFRYCDYCGKQSPYADSYNEAIDIAKKAGWIIQKSGDKWEDCCPTCQELMK